MLAEECTPFVVQERAVGLHGVLEGHARPLVLVLEFYGTPVEVEAHQGWFSTLPGHRYLVGPVGLDELPDIMFQHYVSHAKVAAGIELFFIEEKAIRAIQVAGRAGGLGQYMDSRG
jgi:hypothetical protein